MPWDSSLMGRAHFLLPFAPAKQSRRTIQRHLLWFLSQPLGSFCQDAGRRSCGDPAAPDLVQGYDTGFMEDRQQVWLGDCRLVLSNLLQCLVSSQAVRLIAHATSASVPAAPLLAMPLRPGRTPTDASSPGGSARLQSHRPHYTMLDHR